MKLLIVGSIRVHVLRLATYYADQQKQGCLLHLNQPQIQKEYNKCESITVTYDIESLIENAESKTLIVDMSHISRDVFEKLLTHQNNVILTTSNPTQTISPADVVKFDEIFFTKSRYKNRIHKYYQFFFTNSKYLLEDIEQRLSRLKGGNIPEYLSLNPSTNELVNCSINVRVPEHKEDRTNIVSQGLPNAGHTEKTKVNLIANLWHNRNHDVSEKMKSLLDNHLLKAMFIWSEHKTHEMGTTVRFELVPHRQDLFTVLLMNIIRSLKENDLISDGGVFV